MKNILAILLVILSSVPVFSQQAIDTTSLKRSNKDSAEFLMTRSDEQKTWAYILAGIGLVSGVIALAKMATDPLEFTSGSTVALTVVTLTSAIGAAALMITSKNTRVRAQSLSQEPASDKLDRSYHQPITDQENKTITIGAPFKHSSIRTLRRTSLGISQDKINLGFYSRPAKLNSLVLSISLGN